MHLPGDGVAHALAVLMAGDAVERVGAAIEEEAFLGVYPEAPDATRVRTVSTTSPPCSSSTTQV